MTFAVSFGCLSLSPPVKVIFLNANCIHGLKVFALMFFHIKYQIIFHLFLLDLIFHTLIKLNVYIFNQPWCFWSGEEGWWMLWTIQRRKIGFYTRLWSSVTIYWACNDPDANTFPEHFQSNYIYEWVAGMSAGQSIRFQSVLRAIKVMLPALSVTAYSIPTMILSRSCIWPFRSKFTAFLQAATKCTTSLGLYLPYHPPIKSKRKAWLQQKPR